MPNFGYDAFNNFGSVSAAGDCPNIINLGDASIERMGVDLKMPEGPLTAASVTLSLKGCDTPGGTYVTIVTGEEVGLEQLLAGYSLPAPTFTYKYVKAAIAGTFSGGKLQAIINSYIGK